MVVSAAIRREIVIKENILLVDLQKNEDCEWQRPFYAVSGELVLENVAISTFYSLLHFYSSEQREIKLIVF